MSVQLRRRRSHPTVPCAYRLATQRVGRDYVASLVNTLLLAYAGASRPLLVVSRPRGRAWSGRSPTGPVAEEVVRTLVGRIGLVAAVPITTALAAVMCPPAVPVVSGDAPAGSGTDL